MWFKLLVKSFRVLNSERRKVECTSGSLDFVCLLRITHFSQVSSSIRMLALVGWFSAVNDQCIRAKVESVACLIGGLQNSTVESLYRYVHSLVSIIMI